MNRAILLISCPDQKGITAAVTSFVAQNNGNIVHADQHIDEQSGTFFMRLEWSLDGFKMPEADISKTFLPIVQKFHMAWELSFTSVQQRAAIFVSKHTHCLQDLLIRHKAGQLPCDISLIMSNHRDAKLLADQSGVRFL